MGFGADLNAANTTPDSYVTTGGAVVPLTSYRGVGGPTVDEIDIGVVSTREGGTYVIFDDIRNLAPGEAQSLLHALYPPSNWVEFDTLPLIDDLRIPNGNWQRSPTREPIIKTFPEFGTGGP